MRPCGASTVATGLRHVATVGKSLSDHQFRIDEQALLLPAVQLSHVSRLDQDVHRGIPAVREVQPHWEAFSQMVLTSISPDKK